MLHANILQKNVTQRSKLNVITPRNQNKISIGNLTIDDTKKEIKTNDNKNKKNSNNHNKYENSYENESTDNV